MIDTERIRAVRRILFGVGCAFIAIGLGANYWIVSGTFIAAAMSIFVATPGEPK